MVDGVMHGAVPTTNKIKTDANVLKNEDKIENTRSTSVKRRGWESSADVDNIPTEVLKYGGSGIIDGITVVCRTIWTTAQMARERDTVPDYPINQSKPVTPMRR